MLPLIIEANVPMLIPSFGDTYDAYWLELISYHHSRYTQVYKFYQLTFTVAIGPDVVVVVDDVDVVGGEDGVVVDEDVVVDGDDVDGVVVVVDGDDVDIVEEDGNGFIILATNMRYNKTIMINTTRAIIAIVSLSILFKMKIHSRL